jgi:hypothetical protein
MFMRSAKFFAAIAILMSLSGCQSTREATLPQELVGVWRTTHPKYADRFFELTGRQITFGMGGNSLTKYTIAGIEHRHKEGEVLYRILYWSEDVQEDVFAIRYSSQTGVVRLDNQNQVEWKKKGKLSPAAVVRQTT